MYFKNATQHAHPPDGFASGDAQLDVVDIQQVWETVQNNLPILVEELSKIVPQE